MPCHWGYAAEHVVTQSSPTGSQCLPAVGCAEAGRYIGRTPELSHLPAAGDEVTYVSLGEGATSEGEFWESLNTACTPAPARCSTSWPTTATPSRSRCPTSLRPRSRSWCGASGAWRCCASTARDYLEVRSWSESAIAHVRAGVGPLLIHADVTRPYSHSAADTQSKYRSERELAEEAERDPIGRLEHVLVEHGALSPPEAAAIREEARQVVADAAKQALAAPRPDVDSVLDHVVALPDRPVPPADYDGGDDGRARRGDQRRAPRAHGRRRPHPRLR